MRHGDSLLGDAQVGRALSSSRSLRFVGLYVEMATELERLLQKVGTVQSRSTMPRHHVNGTATSEEVYFFGRST